jgi:DNA-binding winged helix-turn-helix (wHTH) protein
METYLLDDLCLDTTRRQVFRDGRSIAMPALSFNTLLVLVEASPNAVSVDALIEQAWNGLVVSNETVTQRIRLLRQTLGDDIQQPRYIETIRNEGYRLIPPAQHETANASQNTGWSTIATLLALLIGVLVWFWPVHNKNRSLISAVGTMHTDFSPNHR